MYGHRRAGSSSGGSAGAQAMAINNGGGGLHRNASMSRLSSSAPNHNNDAHYYQQQLAQQGQHLQQKGIYASTASSRQHAETIAARRSSTPISSPAVGPKSTARLRLNSGHGANNADAPLPSPTQHPRRGGTPLTIHTGFANGHPPQHTLRHAKSHQQPLNSQRQNYDSRRASTPSPSPGKRLSRSDSDGVALASQGNHTRGHSINGGNGRPLSRIGAANMMTTTATATNMVHGMASPSLNAFNNTSAGADGHFGFSHHGQHEVYHTHHSNISASRRISGSWDDNQNVYERLASVHTQASQARLLATRNSAYPSAPAGGSMMTSGNMSSIGFGSGRATPQMRMNHRPSIDGGMMSMAAVAAAAAAHAQAHGGGDEGASGAGVNNGSGEDSHGGANGERNNWSSTSSSSVTSASTTTSTLTTATNSPTHHESSSSGHGGEGSSLRESLTKAEVGPVF
ncbi:hypothetical protein BGZ97_009681 [Linnemannia gamsii]|uniref:Uncharacterized protein n=1 Tax=Linnemannia gamsii TaxID=64522 RepID=A0A9P6QL64_9FUNG|nr:hypothetical protein BGZ97_009681 [Linnemannia gamsii]